LCRRRRWLIQLTKEETAALIDAVDISGDGVVEKEEFSAMLSGSRVRDEEKANKSRSKPQQPAAAAPPAPAPVAPAAGVSPGKDAKVPVPPTGAALSRPAPRRGNVTSLPAPLQENQSKRPATIANFDVSLLPSDNRRQVRQVTITEEYDIIGVIGHNSATSQRITLNGSPVMVYWGVG
jgi:hypothetical protein